MRFTASLLGFELDLTFGPAATASEDDPLRDLGATGHTPVGFVASFETPDMVGLPPDRSNGWPDEDRRR